MPLTNPGLGHSRTVMSDLMVVQTQHPLPFNVYDDFGKHNFLFLGQFLINPQAGTILGNPQLALWHSYNNEAPGDFGVSSKM